MKITYIGHSGFAVEVGDICIIIDYYYDHNGVVADLLRDKRKIYILASHSHPDHYNPEIFDFINYNNEIEYVLSSDIRKKAVKVAKANEISENIHFLHRHESYIDENIMIETFDSTDVGVSFYIEAGGYKLFHAGDLNNWLWENESTEKELRKAEGDFLAALRGISRNVLALDVAMFPVDPRMGGDFARGARQFVHSIEVGMFIPMHTWGMTELACDFDLYRNRDRGDYVCMAEGETVEINK